MLTILQAAYWHEGVIKTLPRPFRHMDIYLALRDRASDKREGFVTSEGHFVDRTEAYKIALEANQILPSEMYESRPNQLYTEDLW